MKTEIRIAGLGGQGVVLAGQILGTAAAYDGKNVTQTQTYGAEARGSLTRSEIIISDEKIGYPLVRKCDIMVAMSQEALERNLKDLDRCGVLIIDSTNVRRVPKVQAKTFAFSATETAEKSFGTKTFANIIIIGALIALTRIVTESSTIKAISDTVREEANETNQEAFKIGQQLSKNERTTVSQ